MTGRKATELDRNLAHARLSGLGAWNGNGLKAFLADTSPADSNRTWMEPLVELLTRVREGVDAGETVNLSASEQVTFDELAEYQDNFAAALE